MITSILITSIMITSIMKDNFHTDSFNNDNFQNDNFHNNNFHTDKICYDNTAVHSDNASKIYRQLLPQPSPPRSSTSSTTKNKPKSSLRVPSVILGSFKRHQIRSCEATAVTTYTNAYTINA